MLPVNAGGLAGVKGQDFVLTLDTTYGVVFLAAATLRVVELPRPARRAQADLDKHIDLDVGAYGEDSTDRPPLVAMVQQRAAAKCGQAFTEQNCVIIGDNSHDVTAAHEGGASVIAVASGRDTIKQLREAGAGIVLPDLTSTAKVIAAVMNATSSGTQS
jgi:phosphoglycolate phosphatase-like HAD superfamily hydrolase